MIADILERFQGKRVLVLGDVMLDHYVWGDVERISPEAPVPVLEVQKEEFRLGGAANVALNIRTLSGEPLLLGVIGKDSAANDIIHLLQEKDIATDGLVIDSSRSTTLKTRIGAINQQIVRLDYETKNDINLETMRKLLTNLEGLLKNCDAMIIEDYNKGLLTAKVIEEALRYAREKNVPVAVDPKQKNFMAYQGVDIFKPNYKELQTISGKIFETEAEFIKTARDFQHRMNIKNFIVTRGAQGMYVLEGIGGPIHLPTCAREVYDVSGAGDTVISTLTLAYISGADIFLAADIANHAAGVVCGIKGTASITTDQLLSSYND
ncbi:MAG: D-glycero-beta-D-manno-heptose-7-phosphate kinase [Candidatus Cloacimonadaceae bacterium]|jgi:rfaE bifunctional protein kinase chain/domain|nr:D-glycero-beta-D-manno-heptose-7-phosphate kinase [Candidatus Cloacimonadota bacterium]MDD5624197.1 D-glycero-beta-D-manno-heptose-7-phosphate kinase [Candidatus Cloacimonadota bacterium]MDY0111555.1 D-glycero-beta-D-manno-heptose-7-phosphate kinase [Candidatus Syntrophosphaera sp.]